MMDEGTLQHLRSLAKEMADTTEGFSCKGTVLETRTVKVHGRAFVFLGKREIRLKVEKSIAQAKKLASVGGGGWAKIAPEDDVPLDVLEKWMRESYVLVAGGTRGTKPKAKKAKKAKKRR